MLASPPPSEPTTAGRAPWAAGALALALAGCGPSLSDRPSDFKGNAEVQIAVLCGGETVGGTESDAAWIKTTVRAQEGVAVDWAGITVSAQNARAVRRAAGRVSDVEGGGEQRILTWWFVAAPVDGSRAASLGPVAVDYSVPGGSLRMESGHCPLKIR